MSLITTQLAFALQSQSQWAIGVPNSGITYLVRGPTLQLQQNSITALINEMQQGAQGFEIESLSSILYLNGDDPNQVYVSLFEQTDQIAINGDVIFTCAEGATIDDSFVEAAAELALFFA